MVIGADKGVLKMRGFMFCGQNSIDNKLIVKSINRQPLPSPKTVLNSINGRDGSYNYSEDNNDSRMHYEDRIFELQVAVVGKNIKEVQHNLSAHVVPFLLGKRGDLIFDDSPYTVWKNAFIPQGVNFTYQLSRIGQASLFFRVDPFAQTIFNSLGANVPEDTSYNFLKSRYTKTISTPGTITIDNIGTWYSKPIIKAVGTGSLIEINMNGKAIIVGIPFTGTDTIVIDFGNEYVTKNNTSIMANAFGIFGELKPGENTITIGGTFSSLTLEFRIYFQFAYEAGDLSAESLQ